MSSSKYHFENTFSDYGPEVAKACIRDGSIIGSSRLVNRLEEKWQSVVRSLRHADTPHDYTVYTGGAGEALLRLRRAPFDRDNLLEIKQMLAPPAKLHYKRCTFLCGAAGPLAVGAVVCHRLSDAHGATGASAEVAQHIDALRSLECTVSDLCDPNVPNEYLYGRAGYLYALLYVNKHVTPPPFEANFIRKIIEIILESGKNLAGGGHLKCPLMYMWHDSYYLGAAHGFAGILYLLLQARELLLETELHQLILPTVDYLATLQFASGNYPSSIGREHDRLVQWCHGAPGFLYMFTAAYRVSGQPEYLQKAVECGEVIWSRGLLTKGYSLCHGVAGNAYCFLELYQTTKDEKHLYRAIKFAEWCFDYTKKHEHHTPDAPFSLYEGMAGPMYLLLDIQTPMEAKFPGFSL